MQPSTEDVADPVAAGHASGVNGEAEELAGEAEDFAGAAEPEAAAAGAAPLASPGQGP